MKIVRTVYTGNCWRSGATDVDRRVETAIINTDGTTMNSVEFSEGEPEDMVLFRDLSDAYDIIDLLELAYELGRDGVEMTVEYNTEEED